MHATVLNFPRLIEVKACEVNGRTEKTKVFARSQKRPESQKAMPVQRNAIVTGSTSGIGLSVARALAHAGMNVTINGFGEAGGIESERTKIEKEFGVRCRYSAADMSKPDQIVAMVRDAEREFGSVDVLVNNAGVQFVSPIEDFPPEKWDQIIAIDLSSAFHAMRAVVPGMKQRKWGRIISTASAHSLVASPFKSAYVAAKHGIAGLTKAVALELATYGVTVNCVSPGYVWTPLVEKQIPATMEARHLTREEVIEDVLLEAQPTKKFVTVDCLPSGPTGQFELIAFAAHRNPEEGHDETARQAGSAKCGGDSQGHPQSHQTAVLR